MKGFPAIANRTEYSKDPTVAEKLWALFEKMIGAEFDIGTRETLDLSELMVEVFDRILTTFDEGDRVYILGFGTFVARFTEGRRIRIFWGIEKQIKGRRRIKFKTRDGTTALNPNHGNGWSRKS